MRLTIFSTFVLLSLTSLGQSKEDTFLMYIKAVLPFTHNSDTVSSNDTVFLLFGAVSLHKSKAIVRPDNSGHFTFKKEKWAFGSKNSLIFFKGKEKNYGYGRVVNDSILAKNCWSDSIGFFLTPLKQGLKVLPFEGELVWKKGVGLNGTRKLIVEKDEKHYTIWNLWTDSNGWSFASRSRCIFNDEQFGNLITSSFISIQNTNLMEAGLQCDFYDGIVWRSNSFKFSREVVKLPFPAANEISEIRDKLIGNWTLSDGLLFKDINNKVKLVDVHYSFRFQQNQLIVEKKFTNSKFKDRIDTVKFSVNGSGDFIELNYKFSPFIIKKIEGDQISLCIRDTWFGLNENGVDRRLLLNLKRD